MKSLMLFILIAILLAAGCVAMWYAAMQYRTKEARTSVVLQILKALPESQFVVVTEEHLARISYDDSGFWFGRRSGHASLTVRIYWSMDLDGLQPTDVKVAGRKITVLLPRVQCFDAVPDMASWEFHGKKSGLFYIADVLRARTLREDLFTATSQSLAAMRYRDGIEHRPQVIERLNQQSAALFDGTDLEVAFQ